MPEHIAIPKLLKEEILSVEKLAQDTSGDIYRIIFKSEYTAANAKAGQFINIKCKEEADVYLRRPISICSVNKENKTAAIIFQIKGKGTLYLSQKNPGDKLDIISPLGQGVFSIPQNKRVVLVGGGIGAFPLYELAGQLKNAGNDVTVILGFRNKNLIVIENEFKGICDKLIIATDDGSYGHKGYVTDLLEQETNQNQSKNNNRAVDIIYTCGPRPMLKSVVGIANNNNINCEVSLEERMGCGIGACLVCACKTKSGGDWEYSHVCCDGPVFNSQEVMFDD